MSVKNFTDLSYLAAEDRRTVYILDTNVLLHDPASIFRFDEHIVLIPLLALEEIDAKKNDPGIGYNAREISQKLEMLSSKEGDSAITIPNGKHGVLSFLTGHLSKSFPEELKLDYKDNLMLSQVLGLKDSYYNREFIFVTKDRNLRIKCNAVGLTCLEALIAGHNPFLVQAQIHIDDIGRGNCLGERDVYGPSCRKPGIKLVRSDLRAVFDTIPA